MDFSWIKEREREQDIFNTALAIEKEKDADKPTFKEEILRQTAKSRPVKVGSSDPGRQRDSFGYVGVKYVQPQILIVAAKRWLRHTYLSVEESIANIHQDFKYDHQVIEINNTGIHVWEVLKYVKNLPITAVNTSKNLSVDPTKPFDPFKFPSMDKNDMARWMKLEFELGNIVFPKEMSREMIELQNQVANIVEYKPEGVGTGSVRYMAEGKEHDDLYMALMLDCWYIREHLMKPQFSNAPIAVGGTLNVDEIEPTDRIIEEIKKAMGQQFVNIGNVSVDFPS